MAKKNAQKNLPQIGAQTLALIDAFSLFYKAFFAIRGLTNAQGLPTNAVYGFIRMLQKLLSERCPEYIAVALESPTITFRAEIHETYKANRPAPPSDLVQQIPWLQKVLDGWGLKTLQYNGYEADDVIGAMARKAERDGLNVWIVSADKDLFQLVTEKIRFLRFEGNLIEVYGPPEVKEKIGVRPEQMVDYLALVGDSSDNIPGVPKVGPKTAVELLKEFHSLDNLYANLARVKNPRWRELLAAGEDSARLSQRLACICDTIPLETQWEGMRWHRKMSTPAFVEVCRELGFRTLVQAAETTVSGDMLSGAAEPIAEKEMPQAPPTPLATHYRMISSEAELRAFVAVIREAGILALDVESGSGDPMQCDPVGLSLSVAPGEAAYLPIGHRLMGEEGRQLPMSAIQQLLGPLLADPAIGKIGHDVKRDWKVLRRCGLPLEGIVFDTAIASYLLDAEAGQDLGAMALRLLNVCQRPIEELIGKGRNQISMADVAIDSARDYACQNADLALRLAQTLKTDLAAAQLEPVLHDIELPLIPVLGAMEMEGVRLDVPYLRQLSHRMRKELEALRLKIYEMAGREFNISSTRQVADLLFGQLGLKPVKTGKAGYSTDLSVLESLADKHPLPDLLVRYRGYEKLLTTYVEPLPVLVNPQTGRLHCSFSQTIAATGRLSCSDPNLQNIPVRTEDGRAIRQAFVPNSAGEVLLGADYSQIELRIMAHLSQDEGLTEAFARNQDIHQTTASRIFKVAPGAVTDLMRSQAKVVNFGLLYGMTATRLANECKISRQEAQRFIDDYFAAYPKVRRWIDQLLEQARGDGFVRTLSGRLRRVPGLTQPAMNARRAAERIAINTPVQGTAADMIKMAMIRIAERLKKSHLQGRMLLQIHDELIFTTPRAEAPELEQLVQHEMETALPLSVPVRVNTCVGANWAEI